MPVGAEDLGRLPDDELVRRVARMDPAAHGEMYDRHGGAAFSLACRIAGRGAAQEVVEDTFMHLWRVAGGFDPRQGPFRAWLLRMVRDRSIDTLRGLAAGERRRIEAQARAERECISGAARPAVLAALESLPSEQRQVLELGFFDGWSQAELAQRLGVRADDVKERTRSGLKALQAALDDVMVDTP